MGARLCRDLPCAAQDHIFTNSILMAKLCANFPSQRSHYRAAVMLQPLLDIWQLRTLWRLWQKSRRSHVISADLSKQSALLCCGSEARTLIAHTAAHIRLQRLELFHLCTSALSASPLLSLLSFSSSLSRCSEFCFSFLLLHNEIRTGCSGWDASCSSVLESQRVCLLYSCSSCLSLGKTRWNVLRLTLTLLNSLSAVFPAEKRKMAGWQSSVRAFWSEEKVCNWGPWAGSLRYTSRRIIAWGYNFFFPRRGDSLQYAKWLLFHSVLFLPHLSFEKYNWTWFTDWMNAIAATGRLPCLHYQDQFQFMP